MANLTPNAARRAGYALHVLTASGAVIGMLALQGVVDGEIRIALLWLIASQILDGLDGPIARGLNVEIHAPLIDGHILDLVVDYVTCVVVPVAFMLNFGMLPEKYEALIAGFIFLTSALWFARSDIETDDHWFNGFPAVWNLAVPTFLVFDLTATEVAIFTLILGMSQLTYFKVPHIVRVDQLRRITLPFQRPLGSRPISLPTLFSSPFLSIFCSLESIKPGGVRKEFSFSAVISKRQLKIHQIS